jgi:hypothetical protein
MDFIEQLFGISPDGGSGATELMLLAAPIICIAAVVIYWRRQRSANP